MEIAIVILFFVCIELFYRIKMWKQVVKNQREIISNKDAVIKAYKEIMKTHNIDIQS